MYKSHPLLHEPSPNTSLWRYMDLAKFVAILETRSLFFSRLTSFTDPFEGHPPRSIVEPMTRIPEGISEAELASRKRIVANNLALFEKSRHLLSASCWHANKFESDAMWNLYARKGEGIAILTTFERLKNALAIEGPETSGGLVQYIDYDTHKMDDLNTVQWAVLKRQSFAHEREFRALTFGFGGSSAGGYVPVNVESLLESVYVSPATSDWLVDLINSLLVRYGFKMKAIRSELDLPPSYYGQLTGNSTQRNADPE
jgi:hypothetical protein